MVVIKRKLNKQFSYEENIVASGYSYKDFREDRETDDYAPFENISILNTGTEHIKMFINNEENFRLIPSGTILELNDLFINNVKFENTSSTNNAEFTFQVNNDLSEKKILNEMLNLMVTGKTF